MTIPGVLLSRKEIYVLQNGRARLHQMRDRAYNHQERTIVRITCRGNPHRKRTDMATLFEATLALTYAGQQCINRWNYVCSGTPAAVSKSFGLVSAFGAIETAGVYPSDTILDLLTDLVSVNVVLQQLTALAVYDPTDFYQTPFVPAYTGKVNAADMSPVAALGFRSTQVRRDVRRATKRFVGVPEGSTDNLGAIAPGIYAAMDALADEMGAALTFDDEGNTLTYTPAVCAKQRYNPETGLADPDGTAYRYYPVADGGETAQLAKTAQGIAWQKYTTVRSQVSRQYGHGR